MSKYKGFNYQMFYVEVGNWIDGGMENSIGVCMRNVYVENKQYMGVSGSQQEFVRRLMMVFAVGYQQYYGLPSSTTQQTTTTNINTNIPDFYNKII